MGTNKKTDGEDTVVERPSLLPPEKARTEARVRSHYTKQLLAVAFVIGPLLGSGLWFAYASMVSEDSRVLLSTKLGFLREYNLHFAYASVFLIYLTRFALIVNANGARGPTRVNRPDQHVYRVARTGEMVLMATDGVYGRFNRAQRGIFNADESLPLFLVATVLVAACLGELVCYAILPLYAYGRISSAHAYKEALGARSQGFLLAMIAENATAALTGLIAAKVVLGDALPL